MKKSFAIKNRKGLTIRGVVEWQGKKFGPLVIMCHGYKGFMAQQQIKYPATELVKNGYTVVRFDSTNGIGLSQGPLMDFTLGSYIQDIKSVIEFSLKKFKRRYYLFIGYSAGAMAGYIIGANDKRMEKLVLQGPVYNLKKVFKENRFFPFLEKRGWAIVYSESQRRNVRIGYDFYKEGIRYKSDKYLKKINCPTLVIYGGREKSSFKAGFNALFKRIKSEKKKFIIPNAPHTLRKSIHLKIFTSTIIKWLKNEN